VEGESGGLRGGVMVILKLVFFFSYRIHIMKVKWASQQTNYQLKYKQTKN
jgi:hypothetical protein